MLCYHVGFDGWDLDEFLFLKGKILFKKANFIYKFKGEICYEGKYMSVHGFF